MKKYLLLSLFLLPMLTGFAQWVSPGQGGQYTLASIAADDSVSVTNLQNGMFQIHQNITISRGDVLVLDTTVTQVRVDNDVTIAIYGSIVTAERTGMLLMSGDSTGVNGFGLRIDSAMATTLSHICFEHGNRVVIIQTDMTFDSCEFRDFTSAAINFLNCNPTIQNCYFHHNHAAAITSGANVAGSPRIINNIFYNNVLDNGNFPQINLGPGAEDTIIIQDNHIEGVASTMSGGIGIMNAYGIGNTQMIIQGNTIVHNRYGYTQNGSHIHAFIQDNIIQDNNLETIPNNGGSGISIYGSNTTCAAKIRRNIISGNLWGVTTIYYHGVDMGTADDPGGNVLYDNGNGGTEYELYNNAFSNLSAVGNYWGDNDTAHAEAVIFHQADNSSYGLVTYNPIMLLEPRVLSFGILQSDNPQLTQDLFGYFNDQGDTILFPIGCVIPGDVFSPLIPSVKVPLGVSCSPDPMTPQIFTEPVTYTLSTPHGAMRTFTAIIRIFGGVADNTLQTVSIYPNPCSDRLIIRNEGMEKLTVEVFSVIGQRICHLQTVDTETVLNTADWEKGLYVMQVRQGDKWKTIKIVVR